MGILVHTQVLEVRVESKGTGQEAGSPYLAGFWNSRNLYLNLASRLL